MAQRTFDLADLLTASGAAMACANQRLRAAGAPALLREFQLDLDLGATVQVPHGLGSLLLGGIARRSPQLQAMGQAGEQNVRIHATYIAAPSLNPAADSGGVSSV